MSQLLDLRRLYLLFVKHWFENRKAYGLFFLAVAIFLVGWFSFFLMIGHPDLFDQNTQLTIYFSGLFVAGCLSASFLFQELTTKPKTINYQLLPASTFEKLLCVLFYGVLIFFIGYTLIFYATDFLAVKMANNVYTIDWQKRHGITEIFDASKTINVFLPSADMFIFYPGDNIDLFTAFFPVQSAFILGSIYFNKNSFFKTLIILLLIWLIFFIMEVKILFPLLPRDVRIFRAFTACLVTDNDGNDRIVALPFWLSDLIIFLMRYAITPVLWTAIYYRLKEKEI